MRKVYMVIALVLLALQAWTQDAYRHQLSSSPNTSRFEIVQSERGARYTFKIDKYNGEVFQLVRTSNDNLVWESLGIDPITDLLLDVVIELLPSLSPEKSSKLLEIPPEEIAKLTPEQIAELELENELNSVFPNDSVNFQLFLSGLENRYTFLLHIHSGKTWQLVKDPDSDRLFWSSID